MSGFGSIVDIALAGLLIATLVHAVRLQRALGGLRHDRAALHDAVTGFDTGTRQAEAGLARLRGATNELAVNLRQAEEMRGELQFFAERGEDLVVRLEDLLRQARPPAPSMRSGEPTRPAVAPVIPSAGADLRSGAERNLMAALQGRRP